MSSKRKPASASGLPVLAPTLQLGFYTRLVEAQSTFLLPALLAQVSQLDMGQLDAELLAYAGNARLRHLARAGLRAELVYPVPYLLRTNPRLLAYYRLLLGFSQKEFYSPRAFGAYARLESRGDIPPRLAGDLPALCSSLVASAWTLVKAIPQLSQDVLNALTLVTLGAQWRGSYNTRLGINATRQVFDLIRSIVGSAVRSEPQTAIVVRKAAELGLSV